MTTWAIGDLQGCRPEFERLLERIRFDPARDRLWLCGDLVNRGGESLATLRLVHSLRDAITVTLGNHDLGLLGVAMRDEAAQARVNPELREILFAEDRETLLDWLRQQPLIHHDRELATCLLHAGLSPHWSISQACHEAGIVERALRGPGHRKLLSNLFGNKPARWTPRLRGLERQRATINVLTRMRYCQPDGRIAFDAKGMPGTQKAGLYPWFAVPGHKPRQARIICGHWSTLGRFSGLGVECLDTGCVWGGTLTALCVDGEEPHSVSVAAEPHRKPSDADRPGRNGGQRKPRRKRRPQRRRGAQPDEARATPPASG